MFAGIGWPFPVTNMLPFLEDLNTMNAVVKISTVSFVSRERCDTLFVAFDEEALLVVCVFAGHMNADHSTPQNCRSDVFREICLVLLLV